MSDLRNSIVTILAPWHAAMMDAILSLQGMPGLWPQRLAERLACALEHEPIEALIALVERYGRTERRP